MRAAELLIVLSAMLTAGTAGAAAPDHPGPVPPDVWGDDRTLGVFSWDGTSLHLLAVSPLRDGTPSTTTTYESSVLATGAAGFRDVVTSQRCTLGDRSDCYPVSGRPQLWRWDARGAAYSRVSKREPELGAIRSSSLLGKSYDPENVGDGRRHRLVRGGQRVGCGGVAGVPALAGDAPAV
jgi:hypothetical protein